MNFEVALSITGLALSVAGLIPVFQEPAQKRKAVIWIATILVAGIFAYQALDGWKRHVQIARIKEELIHTLKAEGALPFDDLYQQSYLFDYDLANDALDSLMDDRTVEQQLIEVRTNDGTPYRIRRYQLSELRSN
jgi:hypothetical protein